MQKKYLRILESQSRISFRLAPSVTSQRVHSLSGTLRSTQSKHVIVFTFSSRSEILQVMNSIRTLITCNSHAKLASASVSHSKHYTACLEKACKAHGYTLVSLSRTFYINKVSKSQPSRSYRPLYGRGLRKRIRTSHTHTPISRQVIQSSWKESRLSLVAREKYPYAEQRLMQSTKQRMRMHSFISFTVSVMGNMQAASEDSVMYKVVQI